MNRKSVALFTILALMVAAGVYSSALPARATDTVVTIKLIDHSSNPLDTGTVSYYSGGWHTIGPTSNGIVTVSLAPGTYTFMMSYGGGSVTKDQDISTSSTVTFQTTLVTMKLFASDGTTELVGGAQYYASGWNTFGLGSTTATMELLPLSYTFSVSYVGASLTKDQNVGLNATVLFKTKLVTMKLLDSGNNVLSGGAQYYASGWKTFGTGSTTTTMELLPLNYSFMVSYGGATMSKDQNVGGDPLVVFTGVKVTLQYSGTIQYYADGWKPFTKPSTTLLPGTYSFMFDSYPTSLTIAADTTDSIVVVKLVNSVNVGLAGGVAQYYDGGWKSIGTTPSSGFLVYAIPGLKGTLTFSMGYGGATIQQSPNIATNSIVVFQTTLVTMKLLDSGNNVLSGGAQYYASGWKTFGGGTTTATMELLPTTYTFMVSYGGASVQKSQNVASEPLVVFNTVNVSMELLSSTNSPLAGAGQYYASGWKTFGTVPTTTTMELLPTTYTFMVSYAGASMQKSQDVNSNAAVVFNTKLVTFTLLDSSSAAIAGAGAQYYASGWKTFGTGLTTAPTPIAMELLPTTYTFMVSYGGASIQKSQNVNDYPNVVFQTKLVTMELTDSLGLINEEHKDLGGTGQYYASGWKTFGTTTAKMELLPTTYTFMVSYAGASIQMSQDVTSNQLVQFKTKLVTFELLDSTTAKISGAGTQYYASGWKTFGSGVTSVPTASMELLPTTYTFMVSYLGASMQKSQDVNSNAAVVFQTTLVTMKLLDSSSKEVVSDNAQYYASGWKQFGDGSTTTTMELLPTTYTFSVSYGGATIQKSQDVSSNPIVIFNGVKVTLQFSGAIQYYASGWKTYTKPSMTLLPGTYTFKFDSYQTSLVISSDLTESFVVVKLLNSLNVGLVGGAAQYYDNGWKDIGTTPSSGVLLYGIPGLKSTTSFSMNYIGARQEMSQDISINSYVVFQTKLVTLSLKDSTGAALTSTKVEYYANGWKTFGSTQTPAKMELLPLTYSFAVEYAGARQEQGNQNVATNPNIVFQTKLVTLSLKDSTGAALTSTKVEYYANGWKTFGSTQTPAKMELLPLTSYSFAVEYAGARQEKPQNIVSDANVVFQTKLVTLSLKDSTNTNNLLSTNVQYYAGGWKTFGTSQTPASMELLPLTSYSFAVEYASARQEKPQNIVSDANVVFQTGSVHSVAATCTQYYAGGWRTFTQNMELLPGTYTFKFSDTADTNYAISAGTTNTIH